MDDLITKALEGTLTPDETRDFLNTNLPQGDAGAWNDHLNDIVNRRVQTNPTLDPADTEQVVASTSDGGALGGPWATYADLEAKMRAAGIDGADRGASYPFAGQNERDAVGLYLDISRRNGYGNLQGLGVPEAKESLLNAARVFTKIRNSGVYGNDRIGLSAAVLDRTLEEHLKRADEQISGFRGDPTAAIARREAITAVANRLRTLSPEGKDMLVKAAIVRSKDRPRNEMEAAAYRGLLADETIFRAPVEMLAGIGAELSRMWYDADPYRFALQDRLTLSEATAGLATVLGTGADATLAANFERAKVRHLAAKMGVVEMPGGVVRQGFTADDGLNVMTFTTPGTLETLSRAAAATGVIERQQLLDANPGAGAQVRGLMERGRTVEATALVRELGARILQHAAETSATDAGQTVAAGPGLTPLERTQARGVVLAGDIVQRGLAGLLGTGVQAGRDIDAALATAGTLFNDGTGLPNPVEELSQGLVALHPGSSGAEQTVHGPLEALGTFIRLTRDGYALETPGGIRALVENPELHGLGPEGARAVLDATVRPLRESTLTEESADAQEARVQRLNDWIDGKATYDTAWGPAEDYVLTSMHMAAHGVLDTFAGLLDDPAEAPALAFGGAVGARAYSLGRETVGGMFSRWVSAGRVQRYLGQLSYHYPQVARTVLASIRETLRTAGPESTARLEAAAAVARNAVQDLDIHDVMREPGEWARVMGRVWPEISEHLGDLGAALGSRGLAPTWVESLNSTVAAALGRQGRADKSLTTLIGRFGGLDQSLEGLRTLLGTGAAGERLYSAVAGFFDVRKRAPTAAEVADLYPQSVVNLHGLMLAAEKMDLRAPPLRAALARVFPRFAEPGAADAIANATTQAREFLTASAQMAADDVGLQRAWGVVRERRGRIFDVAIDRVRTRVAVQHAEAAALESLHRVTGDQQAMDSALALGAAREATKKRLMLLQEGAQRLAQHPHRRPLALPGDVEAVLLEEVDLPTMSLLMDANPTLWDGMGGDMLWRTKRVRDTEGIRATRARLDRQWRRWEENEAAIRNARAAQDDGIVAATRERIRELDEAARAIERRGEPPDPALELDRAAAVQELDRRRRDLRAGTVTPTEAARREIRRPVLRQRIEETAARLQDLEAGVVRLRVAAPAGVQSLREMLRWNGAPEWLRNHRDLVAGRLQSIQSLKAAGNVSDNPWSLARLPVQVRGAAIDQAIRGSLAEFGVRQSRIEDLAGAMRRMPIEDRARLNEALREGRPPADLLERYPAARRYYRGEHGVGPVHPDPVQAWYDEFGKEFAEFMDRLADSGRVAPAVLRALKRNGYEPRLYGLFERERLVNEARVREETAALGGGRGTGPGRFGPAAARERMQFRRDLDRWRVRVEEPNQVVDELFENPRQALDYLEGHYGPGFVRKLERVEKNVRTGRTPYGDPITIGGPIRDSMEVLDPVLGSNGTATGRLMALREGFRDIALDNLAEAMNLTGGLVLDDAQWTRLKKNGSRMWTQFTRMPDNPRRFGALAGKQVHNSVLGQLQRAARTYDTIHAALDGIREGYLAAGQSVPGTLVEKAPGAVRRAFRTVDRWVIQNQVTYSLGTWLTNLLTLTFSDSVAGSRVFTSDGLASINESLGQMRPGAFRLHRDPVYLEAKRHGLLTGFLETEQGQQLRELAAEQFGIGTKEARDLLALRDRRKALLDRYYQAHLDGNRAVIVDLERDVAAIDGTLREAEMGWVKKMMRWGAEAWQGLGRKDPLGRPVNRVSARLREYYNFLDEFFKLTQFRNLSRTMPGELAAARVRRFSQMYNELPYWLRAVPDGLRSTIVSFPFEAGRIFKNAMLYEPAQTAAFFSVVPMVNMASMATAGVSWERLEAILEARGARDGIGALSRFMFGLYTFDPETQNVMAEVDLGGYFAWGSLMKGRGFLQQVYNDWFPPEKRNALGSVAAAGMGYVSNFFLNNATFNSLGSILTGRDPISGRQLVDQGAPVLQKLRQGTRTFWQALVPPFAPGSRAWGEYLRAGDAGENPRTGRPYNAQYPLTVVTKTLLGLGLRNPPGDEPLVDDHDLALGLTYQVANELAPNARTLQWPIEGERTAIRELLYRAWDEASTPEEKARAWEDLTRVYGEGADARLRGLKMATTRTERQIAMEIEAIRGAGLERFFGGLPIHAQAAALVLMDRSGVSDRLVRDLIVAAKYTNDGKYQGEEDPELVRRAVGVLDQHLRWPDASQRLRELRRHLVEYTSVQAGMLREQERQVLPLRREEAALNKQILKEIER